MNEKVLMEAIENVSLIKGVIDRTSKSFVAFSRIFIYWGMLFIANSIITIWMLMNRDQLLDIATRYPVLNYIFPVGIITLIAALIYRSISNKIPLIGLEKHLMKVWMLILIMNIIPSKITINTAAAGVNMNTVTISTNNFSVMLFSLAIALIATSLFAGYKQLMYVGVVYISISVLHAYFNLPVMSGAFIQVLYLLALPFTFLYTGFFLKSQQARGK